MCGTYNARMLEIHRLYLRKADESLAGAESEYANGRYNNCANRCYYACFQAAVHALTTEGMRSPGRRGEWSHAFVPSQFDGQLVNRRKHFPAELRGALARVYNVRQKADYTEVWLTETEAGRALRQARQFVGAVHAREGRAS
jgi:uncharacterized protein (UPF0332 family)